MSGTALARTAASPSAVFGAGPPADAPSAVPGGVGAVVAGRSRGVRRRARIDPEFLGAARAFRDGIMRDDLAATATIDTISAPLLRRFRRCPVPRADIIAGAAQAWRARMPAAGRLDLAIEATRKRLRIGELRVGAADCRIAMHEDEVGIILVAISFVAEPFRLDLTMPTVAYVSLQALARWFQHALDASTAALLADLHTLACWTATADAEAQHFAVAVPNGQWAGDMDTMTLGPRGETGRVPCVRTFLNAGAPIHH